MTGFEELSPGADWWPDDAMTIALKEAAPKPLPINTSVPQWAFDYVDELSRKAKETDERPTRS